jgi:hypothetical protein
MTRLRLTTKGGKHIVIELLKNKFMLDYVNHLKFSLDHYRFVSERDMVPPLERGNDWQGEIPMNVDRIKSAIHELNAMGTKFPVDPDEVSFVSHGIQSQSLLNRLHRYFTTGGATGKYKAEVDGIVDKHWESMDSTDRFDVMRDCYEKFDFTIHEINSAVHELENYVISDRADLFDRELEYNVFFDSNQMFRADESNRQYFNYITSEHLEFFSNEPIYDVWLPLSQIQGKNYWTAFISYDDPREWDVSSNILYSASFCISDRKWMNNPALLEWLKQHDIEPGPMTGGMPLGRVIEGKWLVNDLQNNDIISIIIEH